MSCENGRHDWPMGGMMCYCGKERWDPDGVTTDAQESLALLTQVTKDLVAASLTMCAEVESSERSRLLFARKLAKAANKANLALREVGA